MAEVEGSIPSGPNFEKIGTEVCKNEVFTSSLGPLSTSLLVLATFSAIASEMQSSGA
jgi:hypothetical protein